MIYIDIKKELKEKYGEIIYINSGTNATIIPWFTETIVLSKIPSTTAFGRKYNDGKKSGIICGHSVDIMMNKPPKRTLTIFNRAELIVSDELNIKNYNTVCICINTVYVTATIRFDSSTLGESVYVLTDFEELGTSKELYTQRRIEEDAKKTCHIKF